MRVTQVPRTARATRGRTAVLAALVTVLAVPIVTSQAQVAAPRCPDRNQIVPVGGNVARWEAIAKPRFDVGPQSMTTYAVQPTDPSIIYVTNGKTIMRTSNSGCTFDEVLELRPEGSGDVALSSLTTTITSLTLPERGSPRRVLATAVEVDAGVGRPHVLRTDTGNNGTWQLADEGLPPVGRPTDLRIAPGDARVAYLSLRAVTGLDDTPAGPLPPITAPAPTPAGPIGALYRSVDGGATWSQVAQSDQLGGASIIDDIAVSDLTTQRVYVIADGVLLSSRDGGESFTDAGLTRAQQSSAGYRFTTLDVFQQRVLAFSRTATGKGPVAVRSNDDGRTYTAANVPFVAESAAHGARTNDVIVGTTLADGTTSVFALSNNRWSEVTPAPNATPFQVQIDRRRSIRFGLSTEKIYRTIADRGRPDVALPPVKSDTDLDNLAGIRAPSLLPRSQTVVLEIGQSQQITYTLQVPRRPTPLDVYILLDNSGSMSAFIDDLRANLAKAVSTLRTSAVNVHAGLGYYKSLTSPPLYDRLVDVGPVDQNFFNQLDSLDPKKTTGNQEPILDALYQSATGEGRSNLTFGPLTTCDLDPGLPGCQIARNKQANFRTDSLRVLLHAGNEEWDRNLEGSPSFDKTAAALRDRSIKHVGIAVLPIARRDMQDMARATGALAGPGGVDCSGDGKPDIGQGQPLVCTGNGELARTLVQILNGVTDVQDLRFFSRRPSPVLRSLAPTRILPINVKADNTATLTATVSCAGVEPGQYEVSFGAALREETIAEAGALVTCGLTPAALTAGGVAAAPAAPQQQAAPVQPVAPAAPAPVPAPAPQINPAPQSQVQPQINTQVNAGTAFEEQEQIQIATVGVDVRQREELAMSALPLDDRDDPVTAAARVLVGGSLVMSACVAVALAQRRRTAALPVRIRTRD
ncbi:MAG TPA: hypothetical protein VNB94_08315 [Mycobacteriales bacterium]|nr:hypothetical protein [Mycobacteriales bacterium]